MISEAYGVVAVTPPAALHEERELSMHQELLPSRRGNAVDDLKVKGDCEHVDLPACHPDQREHEREESRG